MVKVSVVIPVYNTGKFLVRCLDSVRKQTLDGIEVVIVNDGSTDDSELICQDYINKYGLDWKLSTKPNGGLSSARQYGWKLSRGECMVFVDSDDDIHPDYCKLMYEAINTTNSQLAMCGYNLCTEGSNNIVIPNIKDGIIDNVPLRYGKRLIMDTLDGERLPGFLWMRMMKRELITEDCFVNENKVYAEDLVFDLIYSKVLTRIAFIPKPLYNYYVNEGSLTQRFRPNLLEMSTNLNRHFYSYLKSTQLLDRESEHKLSILTIDGVIGAVINAALFGSLRDTRKVMMHANTDKKYLEVFDYLKTNALLTKRQKIWCILINHRISLLPYGYYHYLRLK